MAGVGYRGDIHPWTWEALHAIWREPRSLSSDLARKYRFAIAFGASVGWLTVIHPDGRDYGRHWHITAEGEFALRHHLQGKA